MKNLILFISALLVHSSIFAAFPVTQEFITLNHVAKANFHLGGYLIGLLLGITGVVICYVIDKKDMIRSAWYGFGTRIFLMLSLLAIFLIGLSNSDNDRPYF